MARPISTSPWPSTRAITWNSLPNRKWRQRIRQTNRTSNNNSMKKTLLWGGLLILVIAAIAAAVYWESRPQVLVLKNGTKLTLVGVTYGKHHSFKGLKSTGSRQRGRATIDTTNDTVVVWIEAQ